MARGAGQQAHTSWMASLVALSCTACQSAVCSRFGSQNDHRNDTTTGRHSTAIVIWVPLHESKQQEGKECRKQGPAVPRRNGTPRKRPAVISAVPVLGRLRSTPPNQQHKGPLVTNEPHPPLRSSGNLTGAQPTNGPLILTAHTDKPHSTAQHVAAQGSHDHSAAPTAPSCGNSSTSTHTPPPGTQAGASHCVSVLTCDTATHTPHALLKNKPASHMPLPLPCCSQHSGHSTPPQCL